MRSALRCCLCIFLTAPLLLAGRPTSAQFEDLAARVPATANAIVLLDAQKLLATPLAKREGWAEKYDQAFAAGLATISPDTRQMILASQLDYEYMKPHWELALADFSAPRKVADIARRTKGTLDQIAELPVVALSDDSYCVQLAPTRLGVMSPANRQTIARWVSKVASKPEAALSPYLQATLVASQTSQIVVAFDLQDAVPPEVIRAKLAASSTLAGKNIDLGAAAKALEGLRGMVFEVAVTDNSQGRLRVHFNRDASVLAPVAKPLILEVLGGMGAMIADIRDWSAATEPQRFTLSGPLSADGRKRVLSLIDHPTAALVAANQTTSTSSAQESNRAADATQQYFKAIMSSTDDLREKEMKTWGQKAMWLDNAGRKLDRLPILDVDPDMLAFGRYTSARMRDASAALKGIGITTAAQQAQVYQQYSTSGAGYGGGGAYGYGGGYSYYNEWNNVAGQRRAISAQNRAEGVTMAQAIAREWENETTKVRQAMTQKFRINF
jgi:hypothetical protein